MDLQYARMLRAARERLEAMDLRLAAERAGLARGPEPETVSFGEKLRIRLADLSTDPPLEMWQHLILLQYLAAADGSLPTERWLGLAELPEGGASRAASFDREIGGLVGEGLSGVSPETLERACRDLGGVLREPGRSDLSAEFRFMPRYPLRLELWYADEEFPASGKLLVNDGVKTQLGLEAAGTLGVLLLRRLIRRCGEGRKD